MCYWGIVNLSGTVGQQLIKYLLEKVLEKNSSVIKLTSILDGLKCFTETTRTLPFLGASNKTVTLPQGVHL